MRRVYVAGSLTSTNPVDYLYNCKYMEKAASEVLSWGLSPFCPSLDRMYILGCGEYKFTVEDLKRYSLDWLSVSNYMYIHPNSDWKNSDGVKVEISLAEKLNIPIIHTLEKPVTENKLFFKTW